MDYIFKSRKQYWAALKNLHCSLEGNSTKAKSARRSFYKLTGNKIYQETTYVKNSRKGKGISLKQVRSDFSKAKKDSETKLKGLWKEAKKEGETTRKWKDFRTINAQPDYDVLKESYNSPT